MKKSKISFFIFVFLVSALALTAAEKPRVAVMPFEAGQGISKPEAKYLTDLIRTDLIKTGKYEIISNDQIEQMLKTKQKKQTIGGGSCTSEKCMIDLGNALECEKMIVGSAAGAFGEFTISIKMLDVVKQRYEIAEGISIKNKNEFPSAARRIVRILTGSSTGIEIAREKELEGERLEKERIEREKRERVEAEKERRENESIVLLNKERGVNFNGMIWRSAVLPGWGHLYASQKRGYVYGGLWAGIGGAFLWSHFNYKSKDNQYLDTSVNYDAMYEETNQAFKLRGYLSFAFIGVYLAVLSDIFFTGKTYMMSKGAQVSEIPEFSMVFNNTRMTGPYGIVESGMPYTENRLDFIINRRF